MCRQRYFAFYSVTSTRSRPRPPQVPTRLSYPFVDPRFFVVGGGGYALRFDGVDDWMQLPVLPQLTVNFTIEMWVSTCAVEPHQTFFSKYTTDTQPLIALTSGNRQLSETSPVFTFKVPFTPGAVPYGFDTLTHLSAIDQPVHLAVSVEQVYVSIGVVSRYIVYINGEVSSNITAPLSGTAVKIDAAPLNRVSTGWVIGALFVREPGATRRAHQLCGVVDELRFWSEARTQFDIHRLMYSELGASDKTSSLAAYYNFNTPPSQGLTLLDNTAALNPALLGALSIDEAPSFVPSAFPISGVKLIVVTQEGAPVAFELTTDLPNDTYCRFVTLPLTGQLASVQPITSANYNQTNATVTYTPPTHGSGTPFASFVYQLCTDVGGCTDPVTVDIHVTKHFAPVAGIGGSIALDGSSGWLKLADFQLPITSTYEVWVNMLSTDHAMLLTKHTTAGDNLILFAWVGSSNLLLVSWRGQTFFTSYSIPFNTPTHIAFVLQPYGASGMNVTFYVNGLPRASVVKTAVDLSSHLGLPWVIGQEFDRSSIGDTSEATDFLRGSLDEIRIWKTSRTSEQIYDNYQSTLTGNEPGLFAYYNFDLQLTPQERAVSDRVVNLATTGMGGPDMTIMRRKPTSAVLLSTSAAPVPGSPVAQSVRENTTIDIPLAVASGDAFACTILALPAQGRLYLPDSNIEITAVPMLVPGCVAQYRSVAGAYTDAIVYTAQTALFQASHPSQVKLTVLWQGPEIVRVEASDPFNDDDVFDSADTLRIEFDVPTNQPLVSSKADVDLIFRFDPPLSPTVNYVAAWEDASVCIITFASVPTTSNDTASAPTVGNFTVTVIGAIYRVGLDSVKSSSVSPPLEGTWGVPPLPEGNPMFYIGVVTITVHLPLIVGSVVLTLMQRSSMFVKVHSVPLLLAVTAGNALMLYVPITSIVGSTHFPCAVQYWMTILHLPIVVSAMLTLLYRLHSLVVLQRHKRGWASKALTSADHLQIARLSRLQSVQYTMRWLLTGVSVPVVFGLIAFYAISDGVDYSNGTGCGNGGRLDFTLLAYVVVCISALSTALYAMRDEREGFNIKPMASTYILYLGGLYLIYFILRLTATAGNAYRFDDRYLCWPVAIIHQFVAIFRPILRTTETFATQHQSLDTAGGENETIDDVLGTPLGYNYFYLHCAKEFSTENLLCWKAIEDFRKRTEHSRFADIYTKFIRQDAPLAVNIPSEQRTTIDAMMPRLGITDIGQLQVAYDAIQNELRKLMSSDSLVRFKSTPSFRSYLRKEPIDSKDSILASLDSDKQPSITGSGHRVTHSVTEKPKNSNDALGCGGKAHSNRSMAHRATGSPGGTVRSPNSTTSYAVPLDPSGEIPGVLRLEV